MVSERDSKNVEKQKVFPDNEPIWVVTNDLSLKKRIDDGLYRETVTIKTPRDFQEELTKNLSDKNKRVVNASIIFTENMDNSIQGNSQSIEQVITAINKESKQKDFKYIKVYEIGINVGKSSGMFIGSTRFGTVDEFILYAQNSYREQSINELDPSDKNTQLINSLNVDLNISKNLVEKLTNEKEEIIKELEDKKRELLDLSTNIATNYTPKLEEYQEKVKEFEKINTDLKTALDTSKKLVSEYVKEKETIFSEKERIREELEGFKAVVKDRDNEINLLNLDIINLKDDIKKNIATTNEILNSRVDSEVVLRLNNDKEELQKRLRELEKELKETTIEKTTAEIYLKNKEHELDSVRRSTDALGNVGRTSIIDKKQMNITPLIYFKVFDDLPYHKSMINKLYDLLRERRDITSGKDVRILILRHDDGMDNKIFEDIKLVDKVEMIDTNDRIVRLLPNAISFEGIDKLESITSLLIIVDYISNNDYYLDTLANKSIINLTKKATDLEKYGLLGKSISLNKTSIYPIRYNARIGESETSFGKEKLIEVDVVHHLLPQLEADKII